MKNILKKTILISGLAGIVSSCNEDHGIISKDFNKDGIKDVLVRDTSEATYSERHLYLSNVLDSSFTKYVEIYDGDSISVFRNENDEEYIIYKRDLEDKK